VVERSLTLHCVRVLDPGPDALRLVAASPGPGARVLLEALPYFDGRPTNQAIAAAAERGVIVDRAVVRRLVDFGVLVDPADPTPDEDLLQSARS
jgi:hypothetical protein